jgi:hypothetical protein
VAATRTTTSTIKNTTTTKNTFIDNYTSTYPKDRVTRRLEKNCQIFQRIAQKSCQVKKGQNIYNKAQFESPKHLHQTTFETLKYLQQTMF